MSEKKNKDMSFLGHIGELRGHLIRSMLAIFVTSIGVAVFWRFIVDSVIMGPLKSDFITFRAFNAFGRFVGAGELYTQSFDISKKLVNLNPSGQIASQISAVLICGVILSIPYIIWEIWKFIKPGLNENESKNATGTVIGVTFFFLCGILFSYYLLLPLSTQFLFAYEPFGVHNEWTLPSYISLFVRTLLSMGVVFLLPVFVYFLTSVGILTPSFLTTYRKHAFVVVLIIAAIITPNDVLSMFIAAVPLWLLYELSVVISKRVYSRNKKQENTALIRK